jgi:hypothetical protein
MQEKATAQWLTGGGEMGDLMYAKDWTKTALGPVEQWPAVLVSTLSICLTARFPMAIYWGHEGILLYNDAWRPILGKKHPWAMGRSALEVWPEIWDAIDPVFESVRTTGKASWRGDALLSMQRFGYTEECYFRLHLQPNPWRKRYHRDGEIGCKCGDAARPRSLRKKLTNCSCDPRALK